MNIASLRSIILAFSILFIFIMGLRLYLYKTLLANGHIFDRFMHQTLRYGYYFWDISFHPEDNYI